LIEGLVLPTKLAVQREMLLKQVKILARKQTSTTTAAAAAALTIGADDWWRHCMFSLYPLSSLVSDDIELLTSNLFVIID
jgi:hypothetical protein